MDLTLIPTGGRWIPWMPFSLPQRWPFCWHVALVLDHFTRRLVAFAVFRTEPTAVEVGRVLARAIRKTKASPRHLVTDKGAQFTGRAFRAACRRRGIRQRFGAVGKRGSIAVIDRFIRSMKGECFGHVLVPFSLPRLRRELGLYAKWYNQHRLHQGLAGAAPHDMRDGGTGPPQPPSRCRRDQPELRLVVSHLADRGHLPLVELKKAA